jgi:site-specific recombinase XerD
MKPPDADVPPLVERFLRTGKGRAAGPVLCRFHHWLLAKRMTLAALDPPTLRRFLRLPFRKVITPRTAEAARRGLFAYLDWLHQHGYIEFDARGMALRRFPLPAEAQAFLDGLAPTHRRSTCSNYQHALRRFHAWLSDSRLSLRRLRRPHLEQWLLALHDRRFHPSTQTHLIIALRVYLRWLAEHHFLREDPDDLLRSSDLPKLPTYLPRPLPPEVDRELQRRLAASPDPLWRGLLLMRHTGLRIGELAALEYDCVRVDPQGQRLLKVPLGKLNNERLVPLPDQAVCLIGRLQEPRPLPHTFLLERAPGRPVPYAMFREALVTASEGLDGHSPITSHRLRHTYATALLAGGMSLVSIMKLLGHRDYRMTLRYAAVTPETLGREYRAALHQLEQRYGAELAPPVCADSAVQAALSDALLWIQKHLGHTQGSDVIARSLIKRLRRLQADLRPLLEGIGPE